MMDNERLLQLCVSAYKKVIGKPFFSMKCGPKTEQNCLDFLALQNTLRLSVWKLMEEAVHAYHPEWCEETFGMPYPPFNVVVGPASRKRLCKNHRPKAVATEQEIQGFAEQVAHNLITTIGLVSARAIVSEGWPEDDTLRKAVRHLLDSRCSTDENAGAPNS